MKYSESLKKNKDFQYIYRKGKSYANKYLVMYVLENGTSQNRLGISVSKKVGNSIVKEIEVTNIDKTAPNLAIEVLTKKLSNKVYAT